MRAHLQLSLSTMTAGIAIGVPWRTCGRLAGPHWNWHES